MIQMIAGLAVGLIFGVYGMSEYGRRIRIRKQETRLKWRMKP